MKNKLKILAISGSTRQASSNLLLIKEIEILSSELFEIEVYDKLALLPHFNPDDDNELAPQVIVDFRNTLRNAEGILICSPEYAMGVPGSLKNAIDWTVSSMEFSKKPVALITAGSVGEKAHSSLLGTLLIIEAKLSQHTQLVISSVKSKVKDGKIIDEETLTNVLKLINGLHDLITKEESDLSAPILQNNGLDGLTS
jgi:NAD(P)H-dependent FMN reductase